MTFFVETTVRQVSSLASKPASEISDADIAIAMDALHGDDRVKFLEFSRRESCGRPLFNIVAVDTTAGPGEFAGEYSLGRIIATLSERWPHTRRLDAAWGGQAEQRAHIRYRIEEERKEKEEAVEKLRDAGISIGRLCWISNCLFRGSHIPDDAMEDWLFYEREIVKGRVKPMKLSLYLPGVQSSVR
jgi:hypothetical protein